MLFFEKITSFVTDVCYHRVIKQKQATSKPSKRMVRKTKGPKSERIWRPGCYSSTTS